MMRLSPHVDMAAQTLGKSPMDVATGVVLPAIRPGLWVAALLVFVDTMKELPATILLRPFNFETLATLVYDKASQDSVEGGAVAALFIVATGLIPVAMLTFLELGNPKKNAGMKPAL